jgi:hypothetical protein
VELDAAHVALIACVWQWMGRQNRRNWLDFCSFLSYWWEAAKALTGQNK